MRRHPTAELRSDRILVLSGRAPERFDTQNRHDEPLIRGRRSSAEDILGDMSHIIPAIFDSGVFRPAGADGIGGGQ